MSKVLITGITGFLGAQIAETLIDSGIGVIGLKRVNSNIWRCKRIETKVEWIDIKEGWHDTVSQLSPQSIIHCAWIGVTAKDRNDWQTQAKNILLLIDLLKICETCKIKKFIFMGSQAEYGHISGKISETEQATPSNAYGGIKLACMDILKTFSLSNNIDWIWLRLFSVFGEKEDATWLIPSLIKAMQHQAEMDFTKGDQKYAYLYIKDFAEIIKAILTHKIDSGIYNVSSQDAVPLKTLIEFIKDKVNPSFKLNFGALPYRQHQSMHLEGDISKLISQIGMPRFTEFNLALQKTIEYYTLNYTNESL